MAKNTHTITLNLDFNVERGKLQEIGNMLNKTVGQGLKGGSATGYFNSIKNEATGAIKVINSMYKELYKPSTSKVGLVTAATNIEKEFENLDRKLLSVQGNLTKTFNSKTNIEFLTQLRAIDAELSQLTADYEKIKNLSAQRNMLGNKQDLKSQAADLHKQIEALETKNKLTSAEKKRLEEIKVAEAEINSKLEQKVELQNQINELLQANNVSSKSEMGDKIDNLSKERADILGGAITKEDLVTLRDLLHEVREALRGIKAESNATAGKVETNFNEIDRSISETERETESLKKAWTALGLPLLTLATLARGLRKVVRYSFDYIKNLDSALTEISIVSGKSRDEVLKLTDTFIELSAKTGMAIDDIAQASTIFYQQGLNDEAVKKMTEYTAIFAKISSETVEVASNQITAAINGFNLSVDQAGDVIDKLSVLAAYSAADIDELATAMSKAASQANMAGLSFDQYNAYLATMIEVTREAPENIGTSLKTIMSRFQSIKTGDNTEDDVDVNAVEKALKTVGVQLRDAKGQLRDLGDVLEELGPKWNSLSRNTQAYLGTIIAGTRQQSRFVSLMQNWDRALELTTASQNSAGAATRMHKAAMEGLDAAITRLTNAWQNLISKLANGNTFKGLINLLTGLLKYFGKGNSLLKILTWAFTIFNAKTLLVNAGLAKSHEKVRNLNSLFGLFKEKIGGVRTSLVSLTKVTYDYANAVGQAANNQERLNAATGAGNISSGLGYTNLVKNPNITNILNNNGATGFNLNKPTLREPLTFWDKFKSIGPKIKTATKNIGNLVGSISIAINAGLLLSSAMYSIKGAFTTTADEIREAAQEAYDKTQEEIDSRKELIDSVESNLATYDKLNKKVNKSTEEMEQMADAADKLAKAVPGALVGYDANGNPIIDTNAARSAQKNAKDELAEYAKEQMGNLGNLARADIREMAENTVGNKYSTAQTVGATAAAAGGGFLVAGGLASAGLINGWNPAGWAMMAAAVVTAIGIIIFGASSYMERLETAQEEYRIAVDKATEIQNKYSEEMLKNLSYITDVSVGNGTVRGVNRDNRFAIASRIGNAWLEDQQAELFQQLYNEDIDAEEYEKKYRNLGTEWQKVLNRLGDDGLAKIYSTLDKLAENVGDKTYSSLESAVKKLITSDLHISEKDELFESIKKALMKAVYNGYETSVDDIITQLNNRRNREKAEYIEIEDEDERESAQNRVDKKYDKAVSLVKKMSGKEASFYEKTGVLDNISIFFEVINGASEKLREKLKESEDAATLELIGFLSAYRDRAEEQMSHWDKEDGMYKFWEQEFEGAKTAIEQAWSTMDLSADIPWQQLWDNFDKLTEKVKTAREAAVELVKGEGLDISKWKELTLIFDKIDYSAFDSSQLAQYSAALDVIADSLTVVEGKIYANGKAVNTVADLEKLAIQAQIQATRQELINKQLELEASRDIIDAQIATLEWKIKVAEGSADADEFKAKAEESWLKAANGINTVYVGNNAKVVEAIVKQYSVGFQEILTKYNRMQTAFAKGEVTEADLKSVGNDYSNLAKKLTLNSYSADLDSQGLDVNGLKAQLNAARKAREEYSTQISNINVKLKLLDSGLWTDTNGIGSGSGSKNSNKIEQYIGQLKKIYNILNRIGVLEHRLSTLDTYADVSKGEKYGSLLSERLHMNEELMDQYHFLVSEQKQFTNGYKDFIGTVKGLEGVFDFDKYGQIIINWEKYTQLQDKAANGEVTLKQKADDVYETYTKMFSELHDDFDKYISYLKQVIKLYQESIDAYTEMENKAAKAVKEIYQKILDTKLDAIDKEKEALEELKEARDRANQDTQNAKAVSELQTNMQRALMDTSGASDSAFLKAQKDMNNKLDSIAEDKYSRLLDDLKQQLDDQKEDLQTSFDELWERWDWLFDWLDNSVMQDEEMLFSLLQQTDEWFQSSQLTQKQLVEEWDTKYNTYMANLSGGKSIFDIWEKLEETRKMTESMDQTLINTVSQQSAEIAQTLLSWEKSRTSSYNSGGGSGGGGARTSGGTNITPTTTNKNGVSINPTETNTTVNITYNHIKYRYTKNVSLADDVVPAGQSVTLRSNGGSDPNYRFTGWKINGKIYSGGAKYTPTGKGVTVLADAQWQPVFATSPKTKTDNSRAGKILNKEGFATGGLVTKTGMAMLHGSEQSPEYVLNALQTKHFLDFTDVLSKMYSNVNGATPQMGSSINVGSISFEVESMSSPEDGERAFNMFVDKFKEIGNQTGIKINTFKNTL